MKKRIGIITFHRAHNYGAALQCYALQQTLLHLGYEPVVVDYRQPYIEFAYSVIRWDILRRGLTNLRTLGGYFIKGLPDRWQAARAYQQFRQKHLLCSHKVESAACMPQDIDVYLVGSDQMWGIHCTGGIIDELYFGVFPRPQESKLRGYAISSSLVDLGKIGSQALSSYVKNFDSLTFREKTVCQEVEKMTQTKAQVVLDPTFLPDAKTWEQIASPPLTSKRYLLTYFLHAGAYEPQFVALVHAYAKKLGCIVVDVFKIAKSPNDFLSAIKYASCIITSSFHATAFSLIFRKPFYSLKTDNGRDIRYINLLEKLEIPKRVIDVHELPKVEDMGIDYEQVHLRLDILKQSSFNYLHNL